MAKTSQQSLSKNSVWQNYFAALTGIFIAISLLKFGNPAIFEKMADNPTDIFEIIYQPWPMNWGLIFIFVLTLVGLKIGKINFKRKSFFALLLPLIWLEWQFISATKTVDARLTQSTLKHFTACVVCFYLGWFCLSRTTNFRPLLIALLVGFAFVIFSGWQQHFGGLEQTRRFFYAQPNWRDYPPDFLKKISSERIYSTLFYPNTLAAAILLCLPISLGGLWLLSARWSSAARGILLGSFGIGALGCLFWSGSKSGWLLAMILVFLGLLQLSFRPALKKWLVVILLMIGLGGFAIKYAGFFQRGATSMMARFDYWRAAAEIARKNPWLGTGPGTFFVPYQKIKKPESEMARLCHNDYLEQACDSGIIGFVSFTTLIFGGIVAFRPRANSTSVLKVCVWLGLLGVALHSIVEFNFYIPAIAWPTFLLFGWLGGLRAMETNRQDSAAFVSSGHKK
jgi:O-antigen ligase